MLAATAKKTIPRQINWPVRPADQRLRALISGNRRMGNSTSAGVAPGSVSVKTRVILNVPAGVVEEVVMVTAPVAGVKVQLAPLGKFRQVTDMFVADEGSVTG